MEFTSDFCLLDYLSIREIGFFVALIIFVIVAEWKVYEKAGQPGWTVLIPFYNFYILLKIDFPKFHFLSNPWFWRFKIPWSGGSKLISND